MSKRLSYKRLKDTFAEVGMQVTSYGDYMLHNIDCIKIGVNNGQYVVLFAKNVGVYALLEKGVKIDFDTNIEDGLNVAIKGDVYHYLTNFESFSKVKKYILNNL